MKKMKRVAMLLSLVMVITMLGGCNSSSSTNAETEVTNRPTEAPITTEEPTQETKPSEVENPTEEVTEVVTPTEEQGQEKDKIVEFFWNEEIIVANGFLNVSYKIFLILPSRLSVWITKEKPREIPVAFLLLFNPLIACSPTSCPRWSTG